MALVRTRDAETARDLRQDAFIATLDSLRKGHLREPDKLAAFVYGTARNVINNHLRARAHAPAHEPIAADTLVANDDSVPTSVAVGPDGAHYVGELTGFPLIPGISTIYRLGSAAEPPDVCLTGFTQIIDLDFDKQGRLYILQYGGTLHRVTPDRRAASEGDHQRGMCARYAAGSQEIVVSGLRNPTSVAVGTDGAVYVSNRGTFAATGQVIRFDLQDR